MKRILLVIMSAFIFISSNAVFADDVEPVINYNVSVIKNATPAQCTASWDGDISADQEVTTDGDGMQTSTTSPGVMSCTGCAIEQKSGDCVCKTCYSNYSS
jgi:hypothetical protein